MGVEFGCGLCSSTAWLYIAQHYISTSNSDTSCTTAGTTLFRSSHVTCTRCQVRVFTFFYYTLAGTRSRRERLSASLGSRMQHYRVPAGSSECRGGTIYGRNGATGTRHREAIPPFSPRTAFWPCTSFKSLKKTYTYIYIWVAQPN